MSEVGVITPAKGAASYIVDGLEPEVTQVPHSQAELQAAVAEAQSKGQALIAVGSGARLSIGNIPSAYHTAVSMTGLDKIVAYEPADMTVTVEAGVRIDDIQQVLAERGQFLPLDGSGTAGTVGGLLAANTSGALRHRYGTARDWVIGLRVVHADGTTSKSGGRVVKNVSGYDLHKVHVGAIGTLAIIAEATFKVAPLPRVDRTSSLTCRTAMSAASVISACHERGLSVMAAELLTPTAAQLVQQPARWTALLRLAGGTAAVARTERDIRDLASLADAEVNEADTSLWAEWRHALDTGGLRLRISIPPTRVADTVEALDRRLAGDGVAVSSTAVAGLLRVRVCPRDDARAAVILRQIQEITSARSGYLIVDCAPLELKRGIDVFGAPRRDLTVMRRLKSEFDPTSILSPGRFMGRL